MTEQGNPKNPGDTADSTGESAKNQIVTFENIFGVLTLVASIVVVCVMWAVVSKGIYVTHFSNTLQSQCKIISGSRGLLDEGVLKNGTSDTVNVAGRKTVVQVRISGSKVSIVNVKTGWDICTIKIWLTSWY